MLSLYLSKSISDSLFILSPSKTFSSDDFLRIIQEALDLSYIYFKELLWLISLVNYFEQFFYFGRFCFPVFGNIISNPFSFAHCSS